MNTKPCLSHDDVVAILNAARAEAQKNQWAVSIAVVDDGGHLLHFSRMDGATPANAGIALEKGRTAAISRRSSGKWEEIVKSGRTAMMKMPGILPVQGGMPIMADGCCIGGVGVSGVQSHQDEQIAQAGIDALQQKG